MRMSDWSSDVCSSDLASCVGRIRLHHRTGPCHGWRLHYPLNRTPRTRRAASHEAARFGRILLSTLDRKSGVWGKRVSVRVELGGRRIIKKQQEKHIN